MLGGNPHLIKNINQQNIIYLIRQYGQISRIDLAKKLGISQTAVSKIINHLLEKQIIVEIPDYRARKKVGRRPIKIRLNAHNLYVLAVAIKRYEIEMVLADCSGKVLVGDEIPHTDHLSPEQIKQHMARLCNTIFEKKEVHRNNLQGIGIAVSGTVSQSKGIVDVPPWYSFLNGFALVDFFKQYFPNIPIYIENDIFSMTKAEYNIGHGRGYDCMAMIACTPLGLSVGFMINNILLRGANDLAGEVGTIYIDHSFEKMYLKQYLLLDRKPVLDDLLKTTAISKVAQNAILDGQKSILIDMADREVKNITNSMVFAAAEQGDALSQRLLNEYGELLGFFCNLIINFYDPQVILLDGRTLQQNHFIFERVKKVIQEHCNLVKIAMIDVKFSKYSYDEIAYGAVSLVLQELFKPF